jgi:ribonuclease BN (tRNA processing enzyme)
MRVRLLGAHQGDNTEARFMSILVDGRLAIDAGGLTSGLTEEEQLAIENMLITHRHFDHIMDLPGFTHARWLDKPTPIYLQADTRQALEKHVFNHVLWPAMHEVTEPFHPVHFHEVGINKPFEVDGYRVTPIEMSHSVPTVGFFLERDGKSFFYTADTRGSGQPSWRGIRPDLLIAEVTMASEYEETAHRVGHMTPFSLERELVAFRKAQGYVPRTVCVHINPRHESRIRDEIAAAAGRLDASIELGYEGMEIDL